MLSKDQRGNEAGLANHFADRVINEAHQSLTGGLDPSSVTAIIENSVHALLEQSKLLKTTSYDDVGPSALVRIMGEVARTVDSLYRLVSLATGKPDSRPDFGSAWLSMLSDEQLGQVQKWVEESERTRNSRPTDK